MAMKTETIRVSEEDGVLVPVDRSYRILGTLEYKGVGRVLARASGAFSTFRYNVARIIGEKADGEDKIYELEGLPNSVQEEIFEKHYLSTLQDILK